MTGAEPFGRIEHEIGNISDIVWSARNNLIQVETLSHYAVADDDKLFNLWKCGAKFSVDDLSGYNSWFSKVKAAVSRGVKVDRVHFVPDILTEYLRFEIEVAYLGFCIPSGENVGIIKQSQYPQLFNSLRGDFYLLDHDLPNARLIFPQYDSVNRFTSILELTEVSVIEKYKKIRNEILNSSIPVQDYYNAHR